MMKQEYRVDLSALMRLYETNYAKLMKLLPTSKDVGEGCLFDIQGEHFQLTIIEFTRYTSLLEISQCDDMEYMSPCLRIRMYHDARVAEVCANQQTGYLKPRYDYPNKKMYQRNEKHQMNAFLADWLTHCLRYGVSKTKSIF